MHRKSRRLKRARDVITAAGRCLERIDYKRNEIATLTPSTRAQGMRPVKNTGLANAGNYSSVPAA